MTATVTGAVARRDKELQLINWLRGQQEDLAMAAASHLKPATIIRVAQGALRKDDKLMAAAIANPQSLIHCLLDAARLGHEAGTDQYWLIPFGQEVTGIEGYKGIIERMFRAGGVSAVVAEVVRANDVYRNRGPLTPPVHEFDEFADPEERGPLRGVYAYARMFDGQFSRVIPMGRAEIMKHKEMSKGSGRSDSPWKNWEEAMWKKTPLRALETYVPTSSEWLNVRAQAATASVVAPGWEPPAAAVTATAAPLQLIASEVVEPEPQNVPPAPAAAPTAARSPSGAGGTSAGGGERPPSLASSGQADMIGRRAEKFGYSPAPDDQEAWLRVVARLAGTGELADVKRLTQDQAKQVIRQLDACKDAAALEDLLNDGVMAEEAARDE